MANKPRQRKSRFGFIDDKVLQENLEICFDHILDLTAIADLKNYSLVKESFYKTIIIHTASIIEAVLSFFIVEILKISKYKGKDWKYFDVKILYINKILGEDYQIIAGKRKKDEITINKKTDFNKINTLCLESKIYTEDTYKRIDKVRKLRNKIHLSPLDEIEKSYSKETLNSVFDIAEEVLHIIEKKITHK